MQQKDRDESFPRSQDCTTSLTKNGGKSYGESSPANFFGGQVEKTPRQTLLLAEFSQISFIQGVIELPMLGVINANMLIFLGFPL